MEYSEMTANVLVAFYSTYGHVHRMALAVVEGAESVPDTTVRLRRIAELEEARKALSAQDAYVRAQQAQADIPAVMHDDLRWADGIAWGTPTRYGNMSAQMKQFVDTTGGLWLKANSRTRPPEFSRAPQPSTGARRRGRSKESGTPGVAACSLMPRRVGPCLRSLARSVHVDGLGYNADANPCPPSASRHYSA
jgi:NADPH-dependent FMN reductase